MGVECSGLLKDIAGVLVAEKEEEERCVMMMDDGIWLRFKINFSPP